MSHRINHILQHLAPAPSTCPTVASNTTQSTTSPPSFQYSLDPQNLLSKEQRQFYDEHGYILIKKLVNEEEMEVWRQRFLDISSGKVDKGMMLMMRDIAVQHKKEMGEHAITKLQDWQDDPVLFTYCTHPKVTQYVEAIIGSDFKSVHTMLINKPPEGPAGVGSSRHPPHQDQWYFPFGPSEKIVASWTAMQHIDRENGCLFVKPGSHKGTLLKHTYPNDGIVNKAYHGIQNMTEKDGEAMVHVIMEPGDTIFFHPLLIHGSGRNTSDRYRKAISCHFASTHCDFYECTGSMQEDIAKEIEHIAKMKGMGNLHFNDIWRLKSRLVHGKEHTL